MQNTTETVPSPRPVTKVIKFLLQKVIPKNNDTETLISQLNEYLKKDLVYKAPERLIEYDTWNPFLNILQNNIHDMDEEWKIRIRDIIADDEDIREQLITIKCDDDDEN